MTRFKKLLIAGLSVALVGGVGTVALAQSVSAHGNQRQSHNQWQMANYLMGHWQDILKGGPLIHEHTELTVALLKAQYMNEPDVTALTKAVDNNSVQLADVIGKLYPSTQDQFLQLWRQHLNYYTDYVNSTKAHDATGQQRAKRNLAAFAQQLSDVLGNNSWWLDANKLQDEMMDHVTGTTSVVDSLAAGNYDDVYAKAHTGFEHDTELSATLLAGANFR